MTDVHINPNPRKRRRPAPSCQECKRRKVKCDRSEPCGHCILSKKQCHYSGHYDHGSSKPSRIDIANGRAPTPVSQVSNGLHRSRAPTVPVIPSLPDLPYATPPQPSVSATGPSPAASEATHPSGGITSATTTTNPGLHHIAAGPQDDDRYRDGRISLNKSRLFGQSHWTNATLEVRHALHTGHQPIPR